MVSDTRGINLVREFIELPLPTDTWVWAQRKSDRRLWLDISPKNPIPPEVVKGWMDGKIRLFEQPPPTAKRILLGRVMVGAGVPVLEWTTTETNETFRQVRDRLETASALRAEALLRRYLDWEDRIMLSLALSRFPRHIIEFTTFSEPVGKERLRTLIWEIRDY